MRALFAAAMLIALPACSKPNSLAAFEGSISMHTTAARGDAHDMMVKAKGDKLRFEMAGQGGAPMHAVYDGTGSNQMLLFLDAQKQYMSLDFASPNAPSPNTNPATSTITKAGTHKTVAGYDCEQWSVKDGAGHRSEVCIAQGIAFFDPARLRPGATQQAESSLAKEFREHKSFPLESVEYDTDGKELSRTEVVKIEKAALPDSDFGIPAGYSKVDLPRGNR